MFPYGGATVDCGIAFVNNIEYLDFMAGCFLVGAGFLGHGAWAWFLNDSISCPKQLSLKITFIV